MNHNMWGGPTQNPEAPKNIDFTFTVPADFDQRSDRLTWSFNGETFELPFTIEGVRLAVNASLDKEFYQEGENANLTLEITNESGFDFPGKVRIQLSDFVEMNPISLSAGATITQTFSIPVVFDGNKLTFGVYHSSGRSVYLNAYYLRKLEDVIRLAADKQQYSMGDSARILINADIGGALTLAPPKGWLSLPVAPIDISPGNSSINFTVPMQEKTGTYLVSYVFEYSGEKIEGTLPIDVNGYQIKVKKTGINKTAFSNSDSVQISMRIEASLEMAATLKLFVYDSSGSSLGEFTENSVLSKGWNDLQYTIPFTSHRGGIFSVVYAFWRFRVLSGSPPHVVVHRYYGKVLSRFGYRSRPPQWK